MMVVGDIDWSKAELMARDLCDVEWETEDEMITTHSCYLDKGHIEDHVCGYCEEGHEHIVKEKENA